MNLYLITSMESFSDGDYDTIVVVSFNEETALELAIDEYNFTENSKVQHIGRATRDFISGDLIIGSNQ